MSETTTTTTTYTVAAGNTPNPNFDDCVIVGRGVPNGDLFTLLDGHMLDVLLGEAVALACGLIACTDDNVVDYTAREVRDEIIGQWGDVTEAWIAETDEETMVRVLQGEAPINSSSTELDDDRPDDDRAGPDGTRTGAWTGNYGWIAIPDHAANGAAGS